jgi:flavorubredoxin
MDQPVSVGENIFWVGVNDRETDLFESLWPLPRGIAYNSYLIAGERTALVDTVKGAWYGELREKIRRLLEGKPLDYLIINHIEPDHAGSLGPVLREFPGVKIVGNKRTMDLLDKYHGIREGTLLIADGDTLDLGHHTLRFLVTPMVHWPETMMTFVEEDGTLFSGDVFGGYGALEGGIFDGDSAGPGRRDETLRYYSNVIGTYSSMVQKALARVAEVEVKTIAPAHGPLWRENPGTVVGWYDRWSRQETEQGVVVVYGSMYGNTGRMAEAAARSLAREGVEQVRVHDASRSHPSFLIADIWRFGGVILGSATYNMHLFPRMGNLVELLLQKKVGERNLGIFGSCGWSGGAVRELREFADRAGWKLIDPVVEVMGAPSEETLGECSLLGRKMAESLLWPSLPEGD